MRTILAITKAISDLNRVRILCALSSSGELCACQIRELLSIAPSSTSKHLSLLAAAGIVAVRKDKRWAYYRLADENKMPEQSAGTVSWVIRQATNTKAISDDHSRLQQILAYSPEELCKRQATGIKCCSDPADCSAKD